MQKLNHDVSEGFAEMFGDRFSVIRPERPGIGGLAGMCVRAVRSAIAMRGENGCIHVGDASLSFFGRILAGIAGARLSVTACGLDVTHRPVWYQALLRFGLHGAGKIVCISAATADEVKKRGIPAGRIVVIPCFVRGDEPVRTRREEHLMLTVGRLVPRKGVAHFVENIFPIVLKARPETRYVIVGSGPEESRIRAMIARLRLEKSVMMLTECDDETRDALLMRAAVFAMPNVAIPGDMEGFGIVAIEASARGVPVVGSNIEGLRDAVIDGRTGRLASPGDHAAFAAAILDELSHPRDPAAVARVTHERFARSVILSRYRDDVFA